MAADLIANSSDGAADSVQHQHQPRDQPHSSKFSNEEAATAAAAGKPALISTASKACHFHEAVHLCSGKDAWCKHAVDIVGCCIYPATKISTEGA